MDEAAKSRLAKEALLSLRGLFNFWLVHLLDGFLEGILEDLCSRVGTQMIQGLKAQPPSEPAGSLSQACLLDPSPSC